MDQGTTADAHAICGRFGNISWRAIVVSFGSRQDLLEATSAHVELLKSSADTDVLYGLPAFVDLARGQPLLGPVLEGLLRNAQEFADNAKMHVASVKARA